MNLRDELSNAGLVVLDEKTINGTDLLKVIAAKKWQPGYVGVCTLMKACIEAIPEAQKLEGLSA